VREAQDTEMNGASIRGLSSWIARARSSFPVPLSPWMRTVELLFATVRARSKISSIFSFLLIMSLSLYCFLSSFRKNRFSWTSL
jgi:hypothetical protein